MSINEKLTPFERAEILRSFGYKIPKNSGEVSNIRNIAYNDKNPSLCINLDNGLCKDFGEPRADGDIVNLLMFQMRMNFKEIKDRITAIIGRDLDDAPVLTSNIEVKREEFYTPSVKKWVVDCMSRLNKDSFKQVDYIRWYDGVLSINTLKKYGCGIYDYPDYDFGRSGKAFLNFPMLLIPYKTGAMLYRRDRGKIIRHIKGSRPSDSFFGVMKNMRQDNILIIAKSPRETMSIAEYLNFNYNVIGLSTGENIKYLSETQINQIEYIKNKDYALTIKLLIDYDEDFYHKSLQTANAIKDAGRDKNWVVQLCSIHHASKSMYKDFTDLFTDTVNESELESITPTKKLSHKNFEIFKQALQKPIKTL